MATIEFKDWYTKTILGSNDNGEGASLIGIEDSGSLITATEVEGALAELAGKIVAESLWDRSGTSLIPQTAGDSIGLTGTRIFKGWFTDLEVTNAIAGSVTGNAGTATILETARAINGVDFNGSAAITVTAAASTLTGTTLNATVVTSSLTSVGTLGSLSVTNTITGGTLTDGTASLTGGSLTSVKLGTLTSNGFVITSGGDGTLSVDTSTYLDTTTAGTTYLKLDCSNDPLTNTLDGANATFTTFTDGTASLTGGSLTSVKLGTLTSNGFVTTSGGDGTLSVDTSTYLDTTTAGTTYLKLDCSNDPLTNTLDGANATFTGTVQAEHLYTTDDAVIDDDLTLTGDLLTNLTVLKADPEVRLTDSGDSEYTRVTRADTSALAARYNRVNKPGGMGGSVVEVLIWSSQDGVLAAEEGIQTYGDPDGRTVIQGVTLRQFVGATETIRCDSTGVGIFNTSPTEALDITGNLLVSGTGVFLGAVGLGTATPNKALEVVGPDGIGEGTPTLGSNDVALFRNQGAAGDPANVIMIAGTTSAATLMFGDKDLRAQGQISYDNNLDSLGFFTSSAVKMTILSSGYVGIGVATPSGMLEINSSAAVDMIEVANDTEDSRIRIIAPDDDRAELILGSPTDIAGAVFRWEHDDDLCTIGTANAGGELRFMYDNVQEGMRIDSAGQIGIGDTTPSTILDVVAGSATDPVADAWDTHCGREDQEDLGEVEDSKLSILESVKVYNYKKIAKVSDEQAIKTFGDLEDEEFVMPAQKEIDIKLAEMLAEKQAMPKFTTQRVGLMMDDENIPDEILTFDELGNKTGISLTGWIGFLHSALKESALEIKSLKERITILEK